MMWKLEKVQKKYSYLYEKISRHKELHDVGVLFFLFDLNHTILPQSHQKKKRVRIQM